MNILRAIRRQRLVDRAYSNGYEQGRFDALMDIACGEAQCPAHPTPAPTCSPLTSPDNGRGRK